MSCYLPRTLRRIRAICLTVLLCGTLVSWPATPAKATGSNSAWETLDVSLTGRASLAAATGVLDHRIYVLGGDDYRMRPSRLNIGQVYDPTTKELTDIAPMPVERAGFAAVSGFDGRIYVFGGVDNDLNNPHVLAVHAYEPDANRWVEVAPIPTPRDGLAATRAVDGKIYTIGGTTDDGSKSGALEVYDPSENKWSELKSMPTPRSSLAAATAPDGRIFALGGLNASGTLRSVEIYDPAADSWTEAKDMPVARSGFGAAFDNSGTLYVIGGFDANFQATGRVDTYGLQPGTWSALQVLGSPRAGVAVATGANGEIYALGGYQLQPSGQRNYPTSIEVHGASAATVGWQAAPSMPTGREGLTAVTGPDGRIYAIGGFSDTTGEPLATVEVFNPNATDPASAWTPAPPMPTPRAYLASVVVGNRILAIGGTRGDLSPFDDPVSAPLLSLVEDDHSTLPEGPYGVCYAWTAHGGSTAIQYDRAPSVHVIRGEDVGQAIMVQLPDFPSAEVTGADIYLWFLNPADPSGGGDDCPSARFVGSTTDHEFKISALPPGTAKRPPTGNSTGGSVADVEAYDVTAGTWSKLAPMPEPAWGLSAVLAGDGKVHTLAGAGDVRLVVNPDGTSDLSRRYGCYCAYDPTSDTWEPYAWRSAVTDTVLQALTVGADGRIFVVGGAEIPDKEADTNCTCNGPTTTVVAIEQSGVDPGGEMPLTSAREALAAVTGPDGTIYAIGGAGSPTTGHLASVDAYNPGSKNWSPIEPLQVGRRGLAATVADVCGVPTIFAIGGNSIERPYNAVESYALAPMHTSGPCAPTWASTTPTIFGIDEGVHNPQFLAESGAGWQRVIVPWPEVQPTNASDFSHLGQTLPPTELQAEVTHDVRVAGLLQFTPGWARAQPDQGERSVPKGLDLPFDDPDNYFGNYVYNTVRHYAGQINEWVIWNEPEFKANDAGGGGSFTWTGTDEQFARLLKVGYLAAKRGNPHAVVSFPGTSYWVDVVNGNRPQFYQRILAILKNQNDLDLEHNNWYHDAVALNLYRNPDDVLRVHAIYSSIQQEYGLSKPMWLTETNAMPTNDAQVGCGHAIDNIATTMEQQAAFAIQAYAMAAAAGYERVGFYQMVDDRACTQPALWGAIRDDGSRRPVADALRTAIKNFRDFSQARFVPLPRLEENWPAWPEDATSYVPNWQVYQVAPDKPQTRVTVLWNGDAKPTCVAVPRNGTDARAIDKYGQPVTLTHQGDTWQVTLSGASAHFDLDPQGYYFIGGDPVLLIESGVDSTTPVQPPSTSCN